MIANHQQGLHLELPAAGLVISHGVLADANGLTGRIYLRIGLYRLTLGRDGLTTQEESHYLARCMRAEGVCIGAPWLTAEPCMTRSGDQPIFDCDIPICGGEDRFAI